MRIIVLTKNYGRGFTGATSATVALIDQWLRNPDVQVIVCTQFVVGPQNAGVAVKHCASKRRLLQTLSHLQQLPGLLVGYSDDHLGYLLRLAKIPYLHTYHGNWPDALWQTGASGLLKGAWLMPQYVVTLLNSQWAVSVSRHAYQAIHRLAPTTVWYNGVTVTTHPVAQTRWLQGPQLRLLMVGGVDRRKYGRLALVLQQLPPAVRAQLRIDIYGQVHDARLAQQLRRFTGVSFKGQRATIPYAAYAGLLTTSRTENLAIAVVEAIVSGIPVIGFNVGGLSEVVAQGQLGQLVSTTAPRDLAALLTRCVTQGVCFDFDNRQVIRLFAWPAVAQQYLQQLRRVGKCKSLS